MEKTSKKMKSIRRRVRVRRRWVRRRGRRRRRVVRRQRRRRGRIAKCRFFKWQTPVAFCPLLTIWDSSWHFIPTSFSMSSSLCFCWSISSSRSWASCFWASSSCRLAVSLSRSFCISWGDKNKYKNKVSCANAMIDQWASCPHLHLCTLVSDGLLCLPDILLQGVLLPVTHTKQHTGRTQTHTEVIRTKNHEQPALCCTHTWTCQEERDTGLSFYQIHNVTE